jgi:hypothetical protein
MGSSVTRTGPEETPLSVYAAHRDRVAAATDRMRELCARRHTPAEARPAATALTVALRDATAVVVHALRLAGPPAPLRPRRRWRRPTANRTAPPAVRQWSAELLRLSEIGVWLRRTTLDDPGVHVPTVVRVANYAATFPHVAGLGFGADDDTQASTPHIGVDLQATIDNIDNIDRLQAASSPPAVPPKAA